MFKGLYALFYLVKDVLFIWVRSNFDIIFSDETNINTYL